MKKIIVGILGTAVLLSACGGGARTGQENTQMAKEAGAGAASSPDKAGFLVTALNADIQTADVHKTSKDYMIPLNIFDRLVDIEVAEDKSTRIVPSLASDWEISEDGREYIFHLQKDVKFHNGADFTAEDVVFSLTRILGAEGAVNGDFVSHIEGAREVMEGTKEELTGVTAVDDYTVKIRLSEAYGGFLACLSTTPVSMLDKDSTLEAGDDFGILPELTVGTGPFVFSSWDVNQSLTLTAYEGYWRGAPKLPGVEIRIVPDTETQNMMFRNGELDILDLDFMVSYIPSYKEELADRLFSTPRVGITYFTFNQNHEALGNPDVRKAISMAVDREQIIESIYGGIAGVENGIFPRGLIGHQADLDPISYDPDAARELLAKAGFSEGFSLEIAADSSASQETNSCLEVIAAQLQEIGIDAQVKVYDQATWLATRKSGELGSFMSTWTADYNDPDNFIYTFFGSPENTKLRSLNYPDTGVMERVGAARSIGDATERIAEYNRLERKIVTEDRAWLPLFSREHYFAVSPQVKNFVPNWAGISDLLFFGMEKLP